MFTGSGALVRSLTSTEVSNGCLTNSRTQHLAVKHKLIHKPVWISRRPSASGAQIEAVGGGGSL